MIIREPFGVTSKGESISIFTMQNENGMTVRVLDYGCTIQSLTVPDKNGKPVDVLLGYDDIADYEKGICFYGAVVGRYANRIRNAELHIGGKTYALEKNLGEHHLHGVFSKRVFETEIAGDTLILRRLCPSLEEGIPGNLALEVRYTLRSDNALVLDYRATTDEETVLNLTNHAYFNLNGHDSGSVRGHVLRLDCDCYTDADADHIPTGRLASVDGTPMDLRREKALSEGLGSDFKAIAECNGYDHNYVINGERGTLREFAKLRGERSGIILTAETTQPGVQLYTANFLDEDPVVCGKGGVKYRNYDAVCLETQHYPASPAFPQFPTATLRPGEEFRETTVYRFTTE